MNTIGVFGDRYGRLGNQLFQIALLFALRERTGHDFYLPRADAAIWSCFDLDVAETGPPCANRFGEEHGSCNFDPRVLEQPPGTNFEGYFQSYRYFDDRRAALLRFLRFHNAHSAYSEALLYAYRRRLRRPLVGVHVRRQDYVSTGLSHEWGDLFGDGYYDRARDAIGDGVTYLVFSDDVPWCRETIDLEPVEFADFDTPTSLYLLSGCDVQVIANSSFSWWGAYLGDGSEVFAPSRWFGPAMKPPNDRQDDIIPPRWRTLPVSWDRAGSAAPKSAGSTA